MASALASLGGLSGLAGAAANIKSPADQYVALMQSVTATDKLLDQFELQRLYDKEYRFEAREVLDKNTRIDVGKKDGLVSVEVDDQDPTARCRHRQCLCRAAAPADFGAGGERSAAAPGVLREGTEGGPRPAGQGTAGPAGHRLQRRRAACRTQGGCRKLCAAAGRDHGRRGAHTGAARQPGRQQPRSAAPARPAERTARANWHAWSRPPTPTRGRTTCRSSASTSTAKPCSRCSPASTSWPASMKAAKAR